jgi:hypothetical protein
MTFNTENIQISDCQFQTSGCIILSETEFISIEAKRFGKWAVVILGAAELISDQVAFRNCTVGAITSEDFPVNGIIISGKRQQCWLFKIEIAMVIPSHSCPLFDLGFENIDCDGLIVFLTSGIELTHLSSEQILVFNGLNLNFLSVRQTMFLEISNIFVIIQGASLIGTFWLSQNESRLYFNFCKFIAGNPPFSATIRFYVL